MTRFRAYKMLSVIGNKVNTTRLLLPVKLGVVEAPSAVKALELVSAAVKVPVTSVAVQELDEPKKVHTKGDRN